MSGCRRSAAPTCADGRAGRRSCKGASRFTVLQLAYKSLELIARVALISSCPFRLQHLIKSSSLAPCPRQQIELCLCVCVSVCLSVPVCVWLPSMWTLPWVTVPHVRACPRPKTRRCELYVQRQPKMPKCQSDADETRYPNSSWQQQALIEGELQRHLCVSAFFSEI